MEGSSIVVIQDSDIINNRAQDGAGFDIRIASYVTIKNSNMYGNSGVCPTYTLILLQMI